MGPLMVPHWEVLTGNGRKVLEGLSAMPMSRHCFLAGGTGLALQIGHRVSHDLDLFTDARHVTLTDRGRLLSELRRIGRFTIHQESDGVVLGELLRVKVSFVPHPYRLVTRPARLGRLRVAGPREIGAMKIAAILSRGAKRDFIDLAAILERSSTLRDLITLAGRRYPGSHDLTLQVTRALVDFGLADAQTNPHMLWPGWTWDVVKERLEREARRLGNRLLSRRATG
ncbi:MAG: nucleotidyl transferase AbiEii/AbiGii toxin family protein [bacterium]